MLLTRRMFIVLSVFLFRWLITTAQEQNYYFTGSQQQFQQNYQPTQNGYIGNPQEINTYRKDSSGFDNVETYIPHPDLDTSDLPAHLQRTLPQYQLGLVENPRESFIQFQSTNQGIPLSFNTPTLQNAPPFTNQPTQYTQQIVPSTHRPSYSHLFSKTSHNHDPSQTETFLGQITIQSPADLPAEFQNREVSGFQPSVNFPIQRPQNVIDQLTPPLSSKAKNKNNKNNIPSNDISTTKFVKPPQLVNQHLDFTERPTTSGNTIQLGTGSRTNFLNHRTRIFAPESGRGLKNRPQINDYFVNNNGDVFITTKKNNFSPKPTAAPVHVTTSKRRNHFTPAAPRLHTTEATSSAPVTRVHATTTTKTADNSLNLDSLLEEPLQEENDSSNKDNVEVIQSITVSPDKFYTANSNISMSATTEDLTDYTSTLEDDLTTDDYDYENTESVYEDNSTPSNEETTEDAEINTVEDYTTELQQKYYESENKELLTDYGILNKSLTEYNIAVNNTLENNSNYDVLTMKPSPMVKDHNFKEFVDSTVIDITTEEPTTAFNTEAETLLPVSSSTTSTVHKTGDTEEEEIQKVNNNSQIDTQNKKSILNRNPVVSVVTTKSVINNTIIGTITPNPLVTEQMPSSTVSAVNKNSAYNPVTTHSHLVEQMSSPPQSTDEENSTEGWVVVASVQTSRSVSGARYLPFSVVEQHEKTKPLNEPAEPNNEQSEEPPNNNREETPHSTTFTSSDNDYATLIPNDKQNSSTESLIDKLDRVQSDLLSGLLTGGFNNGANNNIAVITEGILDKGDETTMFDSRTTINSSSTSTTTTTTTTTTTIRPSPPTPPPVVIRKFSPHARPSTTGRPRNASQLAKSRYQTRKMNTPADIDRPQGDQPTKLLVPDIKHKNGTTGRSSGISNKNRVIIQDVNQPKESAISQESLENLLRKIKFQDTSALLPPGYKPPSSDVAENITHSLMTENKSDVSAILPPGYTVPLDSIEKSQNISTIIDTAKIDNISTLLPTDYHAQYNASKNNSYGNSNNIKKFKKDDISALLPTSYKGSIDDSSMKDKIPLSNVFKKVKQDDISALLPPGYKAPSYDHGKNKSDNEQINNLSGLLPPGYKSPKSTTVKSSGVESLLANAKPVDVSALLPPGYKQPKSTIPKSSGVDSLLANAAPVDVSALLPPGYKLPAPTQKSKVESILAKTHSDNVGALLPPGYKMHSSTTGKPKSMADLFENAKQDDIGALLPPGFKSRFTPSKFVTTTTSSTSTTTPKLPLENTVASTTAATGFKVVFPSRPGGIGGRKNQRITTPKTVFNDQGSPVSSGPAINKGWPIRAKTEFTGWPTPSTTPISIEKLLEAARAAAGSSTTTSSTTSTSTTTTTTTTTTTVKPTTPGLCVSECDLAGTIKLVDGAKWVPELLDRNTKEWQILANEVQYQLEDIYSKSDVLNKWYKKIRIDGFSEGSILVDYLVELNNISSQIDTRELKTLFHDALEDAFVKTIREPKASGSSKQQNEDKLTLGNFVVDPTFTDFVVLPKQILPTVGYAEDNVFLPQWAIAIIVIGLASLLFVIIFGVTVLVNKQKNAKKKQPTTLTEDMLNELNKNHMGGIDNYGADDLYNMEDVWDDRPYEAKLPKKRSAGSLHDNSMPNIYDSWKSEWNGYYYNTYYGNHPGSSHSGYGRRRSDYDTNF